MSEQAINVEAWESESKTLLAKLKNSYSVPLALGRNVIESRGFGFFSRVVRVVRVVQNHEGPCFTHFHASFLRLNSAAAYSTSSA
jgi:hypothetical protein